MKTFKQKYSQLKKILSEYEGHLEKFNVIKCDIIRDKIVIQFSEKNGKYARNETKAPTNKIDHLLKVYSDKLRYAKSKKVKKEKNMNYFVMAKSDFVPKL